MNRLEILSAYLPFETQIQHPEWKVPLLMDVQGDASDGRSFSFLDVEYYEAKLILYPLDLTQKIWYNGEEIVPQGGLKISDSRVKELHLEVVLGFANWKTIKQLLAWRINIFTEEELPSTEWINAAELENNPYK